MTNLTAAESRVTHDIVDLSRAKALHATLATRADDRNVPLLGDDLGKGWTLCYHWDTGFVEDLGADGSSKVSHSGHRNSDSPNQSDEFKSRLSTLRILTHDVCGLLGRSPSPQTERLR
jgi:hypothetical protein